MVECPQGEEDMKSILDEDDDFTEPDPDELPGKNKKGPKKVAAEPLSPAASYFFASKQPLRPRPPRKALP